MLILLLFHVAILCAVSGVSANNATAAASTTNTTTQANIAQTNVTTTTTAAVTTSSPGGTAASTAGVQTNDASTTGAPTTSTVTEAPAPPVTTTEDPEAGMFDCFYCGVEDPCDQPFVDNFVGRVNKTSKATEWSHRDQRIAMLLTGVMHCLLLCMDVTI